MLPQFRNRRHSVPQPSTPQDPDLENKLLASTITHSLVRRDSLTTKEKSNSDLQSPTFNIHSPKASTNLFSPRASTVSDVTLSSVECDELPLNYTFSFRRNSSTIFKYMNPDIKAWSVPLGHPDHMQSLPAYLTRFRDDYLDSVDQARKVLGVFISVRLQVDANKPPSRRYSILNPKNHTMFASGKKPPIKSKTNTLNLLSGLLAERPALQEKRVNPLDNNVPGAWPDDIHDAAIDIDLTTALQQVAPESRVTAAKLWCNVLVCTEAEVPATAVVAGEYQELGFMNKKYFIQATIPLYRLIHRIQNKTGPTALAGVYEFVLANNRYLMFKFNSELFKIKLKMLTPPANIFDANDISFPDLAAFADYVDLHDISTNHAAIFRIDDVGNEIPEMSWCDHNGPITGDADLQVVGKRFDMPRIAYTIFWGENPDDHKRFLNGLLLLKKRLECSTYEEFKYFIDTCHLQDFNPLDYIHYKELYDSEHYINYMDEANEERYEYYQEKFMPILDATIARYMREPELLFIVCHSDLYSLVVNTEINHELAIHAPEDTNQHPGVVGSVLCFDADKSTYATENSMSLALAVLHDPKLLENEVIGVNPAYLLDNENEDASSLWLDTILIRCLNAALISDFEFDMHWETIIKVFSYDLVNGPPACEIVNGKLATLRAVIKQAAETAAYEADLLQMQPAAKAVLIKDIREKCIRCELGNIYDKSRQMCEVLIDRLKTPELPNDEEFSTRRFLDLNDEFDVEDEDAEEDVYQARRPKVPTPTLDL